MKGKTIGLSVLSVTVIGLLLAIFFRSQTEQNVFQSPESRLGSGREKVISVPPVILEEDAVSGEATSDMQTQLLALRQMVMDLQNSRQDISKADGVLVKPDNELVDGDEQDPLVAMEEQERQMLEHMKVIESNFEAEDSDDDWSIMAENRLNDAFDDQELSSYFLQSVECHTSLCKMEILHDKGADMTDFRFTLREKISDILPAGAIQPNPYVQGGSIIYLATDTYSLAKKQKGNNY